MFVDALPPHPVPLCVVVLAVATASTDVVARRIPNLIVLCGLAGALLAQVWLLGVRTGGAHWIEGALTGFALLFPFYLLRGMAAGDVKLMMAIGAWVGPEMAFHIALATFLIGGVGSMVVIVYRGKLGQLRASLRSAWARRTGEAAGGTGTESGSPLALGTLPYGVAIAAGTISVLFSSAA
jgi:prepilin peptidase CpaA